MKTIKISGNLSLPLDLVTQTIAILAKRRAGKSYTMRRLVEQLFNAGQQVVLVDPKGDQWGIRSSADGKKPGLPKHSAKRQGMHTKTQKGLLSHGESFAPLVL